MRINELVDLVYQHEEFGTNSDKYVDSNRKVIGKTVFLGLKDYKKYQI